MVDFTGMVSMIGWGIQNPGSALAAAISAALVAVFIGSGVDRNTADQVRLAERRLRSHYFWQQREGHFLMAVEEDVAILENRTAAAA